MTAVTFWMLLHVARKLKKMGWPLPMRIAFMAGMLAGSQDLDREGQCQLANVEGNREKQAIH